jgi:hypothetical protein
MNLGQMLLVVGALSLLGVLILTANTNILETYDAQNTSEFGISAVSLATSLIEEAMGEMYDAAIEDSTYTDLTDSTRLTWPLGPGAMESYRGNEPGTKPFNDFDDYNNLFLVYKSNVAGDTARTAGSSYEMVVPGIRAKYFVKARVNYVHPNNLNGSTTAKTWHKKITVTVTSPSFKDTLSFPAVMSFWN